MPATFYVRTRDKKHYIEAKFLTDRQGNPIVSSNPIQGSYNLFDVDHNPIGTNTNRYVIVPANFDIKTAIDFGRSISQLMEESSDYPDATLANLTEAMRRFGKAFYPGTGELDIQTHYNGGRGENVPAFRDAASYIFGVAGHAAGLSLDALKVGGGAVNLKQYYEGNVKDISGDAFNNPENVNSMTDGYQAQQNRVFGQNQVVYPPSVVRLTSDASSTKPVFPSTHFPAPRDPNAAAPAPNSDGMIGLFSGKPMQFPFAPIFERRVSSGATGGPGRPSALDDLISSFGRSQTPRIDAGAAAPVGSDRQAFTDSGNGAPTLTASPAAFASPTPASPDPQAPLSLNEAYLEYLKRLNASQPQAPV